MTGHHAFDPDFRALLADEAQAPIPAGQLDRLLTAVASRQPRPARLAGLGGRWIGDPSPVTSPLGALRVTVPVLRLSAAVLLLLLTLALIGTAALVGGRLLAPPPDPEKLLYGLDGGIFLADADGGNPVRVAEGADLYPGDPWAPDGRHFLSFDTSRLTTDIRDTDGHVVASLPDGHFAMDWSPDSTRLQAWATRYGRQINIYGIDGVLQAELPLPDGYSRPLVFDGVWAPDGRSVWVQIAPVQGSPCADDSSGYPSECAALEIWELPIDGSAPQRVVGDLDIRVFDPSFSRDGTYLAFSGRGGAMELSVANADGTEARAVVRVGQDSDQGYGSAPIWSPSGEELAYITEGGNLKVVDVATGTARTLSTGWPYTGDPSWSRDGDRIMFSKGSGATQDGVGLGDLWTVGVDGGEPTLLVEGATHGAWQPTPPTAAPTALAVSPSPVAGTPIDTSDWVAFSSDRYGYDLSYPPLWKAEPATRDWALADDVERRFASDAADRFSNNMEAFYVTGFAARLPAGMSEDDWIDAYVRDVGSENATCAGPFPKPETVTIDDNPARLIHNCYNTQAVAFIGDRVHVFAEWRGSNGPFLKAFLSTVRFQP